VPEYTVYAAGASAQKPAIDNLLMVSGTVFDNDKAIAYIVPTNEKHSTPIASYTSTEGKTVKSGIKNTVIYYGTGAIGTAFQGKRVAFVYNTANGSFAGVKQMTSKLPTDATLFKETSSFIVRRTATDTAIPACVTSTWDGTNGGTEQTLISGASSSSKIKSASALFGSGVASRAGTVVCGIDEAAHGFNYTTATTIPGGVAGVQLALADVNPVHASPDVALAVGAPLKAANYQIVPTAVQGFGVVVNDLALKALVKKQKALGMLPASCDDTTITTTTVTGQCQPTVSRVLMTAIVSGTAKPSMVSGDSTDATKIRLERRTNWSGTQAASNLMFAGYGATEGRKFADLADATKFAKLGVTGVVNTWDMTGLTADLVGNVTKSAPTGNFVDMVYNVSGTDVMNHVAEDTTNYSFGVVSLEKVQKNDATSSSGLKSANGNFWASWVKIDGISPNFTGTGAAYDAKQRTGMANGYPMAYEMVAIKNTALMKKGATQLMQKAVVDRVVDGLKNSSYNLAGLSYFSITAGDTDTLPTATPPTSKKAVFTRGGNGANFAPLVANSQ